MQVNEPWSSLVEGYEGTQWFAVVVLTCKK